MCSIKFGCVFFDMKAALHGRNSKDSSALRKMMLCFLFVWWSLGQNLVTKPWCVAPGGCLQATRVLLFCFVCCQLPRCRDDKSSRCFLDRCIRCAWQKWPILLVTWEGANWIQLIIIDYYIINNIFPSIADRCILRCTFFFTTTDMSWH